MKTIVSTQYADGTWRNVGMIGRAIIKARTLASLGRKANLFANRGQWRAEIWAGENIYGEPIRVIYPSGQKDSIVK